MRRTKSARRPKSSKRTTNAAADIESMVDLERDIDGCDIDFTQGALTKDAELPPARGGVETARTRRQTADRR
jgi:hypothetical protein